jgi:hypothetical protein
MLEKKSDNRRRVWRRKAPISIKDVSDIILEREGMEVTIVLKGQKRV